MVCAHPLANTQSHAKLYKFCTYSLYALVVTTLWPNIGFVRELAGGVALFALVAGIITTKEKLIRFTPLRYLIILFLISIPFFAIIPVWGNSHWILLNLDQGWNTIRAATAAGLCLLTLKDDNARQNFFAVITAAIVGFILQIYIIDLPGGNLRPVNNAFNRNDISIMSYILSYPLWFSLLAKSEDKYEACPKIKAITLAIVITCAYIFFSQKTLSVKWTSYEEFNMKYFSPQIIPWCVLAFFAVLLNIYKKHKISFILHIAALAYLGLIILFPPIKFVKFFDLTALTNDNKLTAANITAAASLLTLVIAGAGYLAIGLYKLYMSNEKMRKISALVIILLLYGLVFYCRSRNVMILCLLTFPAMFYIKFGKCWKRCIAFLAICLIAGTAIIGYMLHNRQATNPVTSADGRLYIWYHSADVARSHALLGGGYGMKNFNRVWREKDRVIPKWMNPAAVNEIKETTQHAHNLLLEIITERGIFGLLIMLLPISIFISLCCLRLKSKSTDNNQKFYAKCGIIFMLCAVLSQLLSFFMRQNIETVYWVIAAVILSVIDAKSSEKSDRTELDYFWSIHKKIRLTNIHFLSYPIVFTGLIMLYRPVSANYLQDGAISVFLKTIMYPANAVFSLPEQLLPNAAGVTLIFAAFLAFILWDVISTKIMGRIIKNSALRLIILQFAGLAAISWFVLNLQQQAQ